MAAINQVVSGRGTTPPDATSSIKIRHKLKHARPACCSTHSPAHSSCPCINSSNHTWTLPGILPPASSDPLPPRVVDRHGVLPPGLGTCKSSAHHHWHQSPPVRTTAKKAPSSVAYSTTRVSACSGHLTPPRPNHSQAILPRVIIPHIRPPPCIRYAHLARQWPR